MFLNLLGSLFGLNKKDETPAAAPEDSSVTLARQQGPTAYTDAMRANLGLVGEQGGVPQTSGMTGGVPSFTGYNPQPVQADPLRPLLGQYTPPAEDASATPTPTPAAAAPNSSNWLLSLFGL